MRNRYLVLLIILSSFALSSCSSTRNTDQVTKNQIYENIQDNYLIPILENHAIAKLIDYPINDNFLSSMVRNFGLSNGFVMHSNIDSSFFVFGKSSKPQIAVSYEDFQKPNAINLLVEKTGSLKKLNHDILNNFIVINTSMRKQKGIENLMSLTIYQVSKDVAEVSSFFVFYSCKSQLPDTCKTGLRNFVSSIKLSSV